MTLPELTDQDPPPVQADGEPCPSCGAPLASDQRYCLNCGRSRGMERVPYPGLLAGRDLEQVLPATEPPPPRRRIPPAVGTAAAGAAGALLLAVGVLAGALISNGHDDRPQTVAQAAPQKAPVVNITNTGGGGGGTTDAASSDFTSDWPDGKSGYTVELQELPNDSGDASAVTQAKQDATSKGAKDVGALDSDDYPSLPGGKYVVYSGVFTGKSAKAQAAKALKGLKKNFKDAKVVKVAPDAAAAGSEGTKPEEVEHTVSKSALKDLQNSTGADQQKKSAKLPDTLKIPGKTPKADHKAPNNGKGGGDVIQ
jgi:uncharacterized protein YidB (DUF937 family)